MKLVPIVINEEILGDTTAYIVTAEGQLDLDSGDITVKNYYVLDEHEKKIPYDVKKYGLPAKHDEYDSTSGILTIAEKELEFVIEVNTKTGSYDVNADELEEIKEKAIALASGGNNKQKRTKRY